jgi:predicted amidohydrolase
MFERVGVFHFPERHHAPIPALKDALSQHPGVRNSLIVLPEAFNNGADYNDEDRPPRIDADLMRSELSAIANEHGLLFVAGLLAPMLGEPASCAYLIDGRGSRLMVRKGAEHDVEDPIEAEGVCVGCLICSDAYNFVSRNRVTEKVEKSILARKVVCIPASMSTGTFESPSFPLPEYRNKYVLMANGKPSSFGAGSFIANKGGTKINDRNFDNRHNTIFLATWCELDKLVPAQEF